MKILVGVSGGIAAYKTCELIRYLQKAGHECTVVMTQHATEFVGPATFRALTHNPVAIDLFDAAGAPIHHVSLAADCDVFVIAPATANVIAKIAQGVADDLLTTTALACAAPLVVAPAMNVRMYENRATQENIATLKERGVRIVDAEEGYLACGTSGAGRLADVETIGNAVLDELGSAQDLAGMAILVNAGPTYEPIDPVRFIGNRSSGKTGFALARAAAQRGAKVTLVAGPVSLDTPEGVTRIDVTTAQEMLTACVDAFEACDVAICSAAVADMRPKVCFDKKLKKSEDADVLRVIELVENPDILATLCSLKNAQQIVCGFAAETHDVITYAKEKIDKKGADYIVANKVGEGLAFGTDENKVSVISACCCKSLPLQSKERMAHQILDIVCAPLLRCAY